MLDLSSPYEAPVAQFLRTRSVQDRNKAVLANLGLVYLIITHRFKRHSTNGYGTNESKWGNRTTFEDLFQEGVLGLIRALEAYDPLKGAWGQYASSGIRMKIGEHLRLVVAQENCSIQQRTNQPLQNNRHWSNFRVVGLPPDGGFYQEDLATSPYDHCISPAPLPDSVVEQKMRLETIQKCRMDAKEKAILHNHILGEEKLQDVGQSFGLSKQRMGQIKARLLERLAR